MTPLTPFEHNVLLRYAKPTDMALRWRTKMQGVLNSKIIETRKKLYRLGLVHPTNYVWEITQAGEAALNLERSDV